MKKLLQSYINAFKGLPKMAWLLSAIVLINRSGSMIIFFMSLYLTQELGIDIIAAGKIISLFGMGSIIGSYLGGWLTDKWGSLKVQFYSLAGVGLCYIMLGYLHDITSIGIMVFISSIIGDAFRPANVTAFANICLPGIRPRGFALMRLAINLGMSLGPALGGLLAVKNYLLLFWVDGITCIFAAIAIKLFIEENALSYEQEKRDSTHKVKSPWQDSLYLGLLGLLMIIGVVFFQIFNTWPLYLKEHCHFMENKIGFLLAINAWIIVLVEMPLIHKLEKIKPLKIIKYGIICLFLGFGIMPLGKSYSFIALTVVLWTVGEMLIFPMMAAFVADRAPKESSGTYMGLYTLTFSTSMVFGPFLGSIIYHKLSPNHLWTLSGILGIFVFLGFLSIHRKVTKTHLLLKTT